MNYIVLDLNKELIMLNVIFLSLLMPSLQARGFSQVSIDGSSTVYPITEAIAEEFRSTHPNIRVNIGVSGTGGGFKKFIAGEIHINNASRIMKDNEMSKAKMKSLSYLKIPVAFDGITIVVNKKNDWADSITPAELKRIWDTNSQIKTWKDVRPHWPDRPVKLYGPGTDSGTFDYFTMAINGQSGRCRSNYTKSEDDNVLVKGVAGDRDSLGFFGYAYYKENKNLVKSVPVDSGQGAVSPSETTINDGSYRPLSRPVFIYVSASAAQTSAVRKFVQFYMKNASKLTSEVGYVSLPSQQYKEQLAKFETFSRL